MNHVGKGVQRTTAACFLRSNAGCVALEGAAWHWRGQTGRTGVWGGEEAGGKMSGRHRLEEGNGSKSQMLRRTQRLPGTPFLS